MEEEGTANTANLNENVIQRIQVVLIREHPSSMAGRAGPDERLPWINFLAGVRVSSYGYCTVIWWIFPLLFLCTFPIYLM